VQTGALVFDDVTDGEQLLGVNLRAEGGEIVGVCGLSGSGFQAVLELASGLRRPTSGSVTLPNGNRVPRGLPAAIRAGVGLVTGDRRRLGLMLDKPVWDNIAQVRGVALARGGVYVSRHALAKRAGARVAQLNIRVSSVSARTGALSGGNQQKVVFAKWLEAEPTVLLLDDPTRGVDVGAKAEMHAIMRGIAAAGTVVVLSSTDLDELADLCDRLYVFYQGQVCDELTGDELTAGAALAEMNGEVRTTGTQLE
jgi:ABC-type sugar transport system ATPase subunit